MANEFYVEIAQKQGQATADELKKIFDQQHFKVGASLSEESIKEIQNQLESLSIDIALPDLTNNLNEMFADVSAGLSVLNEDLSDITKTTNEMAKAKQAENREENFEILQLRRKDTETYQYSENARAIEEAFSSGSNLFATNIKGALAAAGVTLAVGAGISDNKRLLQLQQKTDIGLEDLQIFATSILGSQGIGDVSDAIGVIENLRSSVANLRGAGAPSNEDITKLRLAGAGGLADILSGGQINVESLLKGAFETADKFSSLESADKTAISEVFERIYGTSILNFVGGPRGENVFLSQDENLQLNESLRTINVQMAHMATSLVQSVNPALSGLAAILGPIASTVRLFADVIKHVSDTLAFRFGSEEEQVRAAEEAFRSGKEITGVVVPSDIEFKALNKILDEVDPNPTTGRFNNINTGFESSQRMLRESGLTGLINNQGNFDQALFSDTARVSARQRDRAAGILMDILSEQKRMTDLQTQNIPVITKVLGQ